MDIVERLGAASRTYVYSDALPGLLLDARDEITRLRAELHQMVGIADDLRAELAQARKALEKIADHCARYGAGLAFYDVQSVARAALITGTEGEQTIAAFIAQQEPLGAEFAKVWDDNVATLYESDTGTEGEQNA